MTKHMERDNINLRTSAIRTSVLEITIVSGPDERELNAAYLRETMSAASQNTNVISVIHFLMDCGGCDSRRIGSNEGIELRIRLLNPN